MWEWFSNVSSKGSLSEKKKLSDKEPSLKTLENHSHISAVLRPFWLFHIDFHMAYAALHFYDLMQPVCPHYKFALSKFTLI